MKKRIKNFVGLLVILLFTATMMMTAVQETQPETQLQTPKQLWERLQKTLPSLLYTVIRDEIVPSDTDPQKKLRRIEVRFISQEIKGIKMGHTGIVLIPTDSDILNKPERRGKVVVVGQRYGDSTILGNYGEPIAVRTGYPTMVLVLPGDYDGEDGESQWLRFLRQLSRDTKDPINHDLFRSAIPYLRAIDVFSEILKETEIQAIIGGHSKRAYYAFTAAAIDPERIAGVVYMGCERLFYAKESFPTLDLSPPFSDEEKYPASLSPHFTQKFVQCPVLYLGATNEAGYTMFNINKLQARMERPWSIEYIPNYRHASRSEKQIMDWQMWVSHIFDGRLLTKISDLSYEKTEEGTVFRARIDSPNKIIQVKVWYVYCDDVPYWRDLMWYPVIMRPEEANLFKGYVAGKKPDAWLVEVKDIAHGFPGYISSLPQDITHKPAKERNARKPRNWELKQINSSFQRAHKNDVMDVQDADIKVERFKHNPIVTSEMLPEEDGSNINGPSLIRVPDWIKNPLGRYYLYFAHHNGTYIRLAYADSLEGPWKIHKPGVLRIEDTILGHGKKGAHIASPDVHVDHEKKEIRMYFHGTCPEEYDCQQTYGQGSSVAVSQDGINFSASSEFLEDIYFRIFKWKNEYYAFARSGTIYKSDDKDGLKDFKRLRESSTFPGLGKEATIRHVAVKLTDDFLYVFYSCLGHAPERILVSVFRLSDDWVSNWKPSDPIEVLKSKKVYEGIELPIKPSEFGSAKTPVHELRDPFIFTENGQDYLLYSVAGELGIAIARLTIIRGKEND